MLKHENDVNDCPDDSDEGEIIPGCNVSTQSPTVFVEGSSDIHIGPHIQYHAPVTIKQYLTVKEKDIEALPNGKTRAEKLQDCALQINGIKSPQSKYLPNL